MESTSQEDLYIAYMSICMLEIGWPTFHLSQIS